MSSSRLATSASLTGIASRGPARRTLRLPPAIAHAVDALDPVEARVERSELPANALDVRGDRAVVHHHARLAHQLLAVLDVAGMPGERVDDPELREREVDARAPPAGRHALQVDPQRAALDRVLRLRVAALRVDAPEERGDPREEMRQARVLRQVVVRPEPQARDRVELAVAGGQEDDRQRRGEPPELTAQREAAVDLVAEPDVEDRELGQARAERL